MSQTFRLQITPFSTRITALTKHRSTTHLLFNHSVYKRQRIRWAKLGHWFSNRGASVHCRWAVFHKLHDWKVSARDQFLYYLIDIVFFRCKVFQKKTMSDLKFSWSHRWVDCISNQQNTFSPDGEWLVHTNVSCTNQCLNLLILCTKAFHY